MNRTAITCTTIATLGLLGAAFLTAGPLTPPPGPPASTYKTLAQIEPRTPISTAPFIITAPGSYYLTDNLFVPTSGVGITIAASDVTIDLNGFKILGTTASLQAINESPVGRSNITIKNGTIGAFTSVSIALANAQRVTVTGLTIDNGAILGINSVGLDLGPGASVTNTTVANQSVGIRVGQGSLIADTLVRDIGGNAVEARAGSTLRSVTVRGASGSGIVLLDNGSTAHNCTVSEVAGVGFQVGSGSKLTDCSVRRAGANAYDMLAINVTGVVFTRCAATDIAGHGFQLTTGNLVSDCFVGSVGTGSSFASTSARAGVSVSGTDNRIEGSRFYSCNWPILYQSSSNFNSAYRNSAGFCANTYTNSGGPNNLFGPIAGGIPTGPWDNTFQ